MKRFLFRDSKLIWHVADSMGIHSGDQVLHGNVEKLDFNSAINLSYDYLYESDRAADRGEDAVSERWETWSEQLQIWASAHRLQQRPAARSAITIRRSAIFDDAVPTFAEMTRR